MYIYIYYKSLSFIISSVYHHDINHPVPAPDFCRFASSLHGFPLFEAVRQTGRPTSCCELWLETIIARSLLLQTLPSCSHMETFVGLVGGSGV